MLVTPEERAEGKLSAAHLAEGRMCIRDAGYVMLEGALEPETVAAANDEYTRLFRELRSRGISGKLERSHSGEGNFQIEPPMGGVLGSPDLIANPPAMGLLREVLGDDLRLLYYNSNITEPGSTIQQIHRDNGHLFGEEMAVATPAFSLVVNVLLCDFTSENGSTEVWPGSHLLMDAHLGESAVHPIDKRAEAMPSRRLDAPAGTLVIRDVRLWHRGMPNRTQQLRSMLSLVYKRSWLKWRYADSVTPPPSVFSAWPAHVQELVAP